MYFLTYRRECTCFTVWLLLYLYKSTQALHEILYFILGSHMKYSALLYVPVFLGFGPDRGQTSKAAGSSGSAGQHCQHQHPAETPAQL